MMRCGSEFAAGAFDRIGITVALGAGHGKRIGGDEFVERSAMAVGGDVAAFRLSNLQEVHSNAGQADGLRGSRAFVGRGHSLQREVIDDEEKGGCDKNADKSAHEEIVARLEAHFKESAGRVALGNNLLRFNREQHDDMAAALFHFCG